MRVVGQTCLGGRREEANRINLGYSLQDKTGPPADFGR